MKHAPVSGKVTRRLGTRPGLPGAPTLQAELESRNWSLLAAETRHALDQIR
jgi:hypothetical protein